MKLRNRPFVFCIGIVIILFASTSALAVDLGLYAGNSFLVHVKQKGFCALDDSLTTALDKNNDIENIYIKLGSWKDSSFVNSTYYFEDDGIWYSVPFTLKYKFGTAKDAVLETDPPFSYNSDYPASSCELTTIYLGIRLVKKFENGIPTGKIFHVAGVGKDKECIVEITILSSKMVDVSSVPNAVQIPSCVP